MTRLVWGQSNQVGYEAGVDRGVLYPLGGTGVAWNGLLAIDESREGGEIESFHYDGIKYLDVVANKTFKATLKALSSPEEFDPCKGLRSVVPGFIITRQERVRFGLSYRTGAGDNYKIHLIYNALATPSNRAYATLTDSANPSELEWTIDAVPPASSGYRPTAHFIIDSRKTDPWILKDIEDNLYGSATKTPTLPSSDDVYKVFHNFISEPIAEPI